MEFLLSLLVLVVPILVLWGLFKLRAIDNKRRFMQELKWKDEYEEKKLKGEQK